MKFSIDWLKNYIDIDMEAAEVSAVLTNAGLEVEGIDFKSLDFKGVVAVRLEKVRPHPDADGLIVCVAREKDNVYDVVCGDKNLQEGDIVPLAAPGASLPGGLVVESKSVRGVVSAGMFCSEKELGLSEDGAGVMLLPDDTSPGTQLDELLGASSALLKIDTDGTGKRTAKVNDFSDSIFEVGLTPNRSDCLSLFGFARELSALTSGTAKEPVIKVEESQRDVKKDITVENQEPSLCTRYTARIIKGVTVKPSPLWLRRRLEASGVRPINNIVDVTNYVMMELGQPLHAFDLAKIGGGKIVVRLAKKGDTLLTLDDVERKFDGYELLICDANRPVALAGVMGGEKSSVSETTTDILIESAHFAPETVRRTARRLGLHTESSHRFERGVDPEGTVRALDRAAMLISELAGGEVSAGVVNSSPDPVKREAIPFRPEKCRATLGLQIDNNEMTDYFRALGMAVEGEGERYDVTPPSYRVDIEREVDLIEEVARLKGYNAIPADYSLGEMTHSSGQRGSNSLYPVKSFMAGAGFDEVLNYSFLSPADIERLNLPEDSHLKNGVKLLNPISEDLSLMRTTLLPGLLNTVSLNMNRQVKDLRLFETGTVFSHKEDGYGERHRLAAVISGDRRPLLWRGESDLYDLKGCLENLLDLLEVRDYTFVNSDDLEFGHPGRSARVFSGSLEIARICEVDPSISENFDIDGRVDYFDLDLDALKTLPRAEKFFSEIASFPYVERDAAFLVDESLPLADILSVVEQEGGPLLESVEVFDQFRGKGMADGEKSLAVRLRYRSKEKTLTDEEVNEAHRAITDLVCKKVNATIR